MAKPPTVNDKLIEEMEVVQRDDQRILPADVVAYARNNLDSEVRRHFDRQHLFDDSVAAEKARLLYANRLIRQVEVVIKTRPKRKASYYVECVSKSSGYEPRELVLRESSKRQAFREQLAKRLLGHLERNVDFFEPHEVDGLRAIVDSLCTDVAEEDVA